MPTGCRSSGRESSREPGRFDQTALDTYRRHARSAAASAGIEPLVTLHHFTNPDLAGRRRAAGANPDVVPRFAALRRPASRDSWAIWSRWWVTINEPSILALKGYIEGSWPPQRPWDLRGYVRLLRHAARAHALARRAHQGAAR